MPGNPQQIDWQGLKAAAIALQSVQDAARRASAHLPAIEQRRFIERVNKRAYRERWLDRATALSLSAPTNAKPLSNSVQSGSELLQSTLADDARETKISLSKGVRKAAKHIENLPGEGVFSKAKNVKEIVGAASQLHGWDQQSGNIGALNLNILMGQAVIMQSSNSAKGV